MSEIIPFSKGEESFPLLLSEKIIYSLFIIQKLHLFVESKIDRNSVFLIEGKYSKSTNLPSKGDIKDGLLKMILYSNLTSVTANKKKITSVAVLSLTSSKLKSSVSSTDNKTTVSAFFTKNKFTTSQIKLVNDVFEEANQNNFIVQLGFSK